MIKEQLQLDGTVGIFVPVKKLQLNCFKKHLRKTPIKLKDNIVQVRDDANIWKKVTIISKSRKIYCNKIISNQELTIGWDKMRSLYSGHKGNSKLLSDIKL